MICSSSASNGALALGARDAHERQVQPHQAPAQMLPFVERIVGLALTFDFLLLDVGPVDVHPALEQTVALAFALDHGALMQQQPPLGRKDIPLQCLVDLDLAWLQLVQLGLHRTSRMA
jgi:hypothetical protein